MSRRWEWEYYAIISFNEKKYSRTVFSIAIIHVKKQLRLKRQLCDGSSFASETKDWKRNEARDKAVALPPRIIISHVRFLLFLQLKASMCLCKTAVASSLIVLQATAKQSLMNIKPCLWIFQSLNIISEEAETKKFRKQSVVNGVYHLSMFGYRISNYFFHLFVFQSKLH